MLFFRKVNERNKMSLSDIQKKVFDSYSHAPSYKTVMIGMSLGVMRIATSRLCLNSLPWLNKILKPPPKKWNPAILLPVATALAAPFLEEPLFRGQLSKKSKYQMLLANAVIFGAMHGFLKGSLELRAARVFMSTIGGLHYCAAQNITGDLWAPTIAHLMYNTCSLADALSKS